MRPVSQPDKRLIGTDEQVVERLRSTTATRSASVRMTREEFVAKLRAQQRLRFHRPDHRA